MSPFQGLEPRSRREPPRLGGFSLIEVMIAVALLPVLFVAVLQAIRSGYDMQETTAKRSSMEQSLRTSLRRIADDLFSASKVGEDQDGNGNLDAGEDLNGNGRLDADWAITGSSVTFNRFRSDGTYSLPITYRQRGDLLEMVRTIDAAGNTIRTTLASRVASFSVSEVDSRVTITLTTDRYVKGGRSMTASATTTVVMRN